MLAQRRIDRGDAVLGELVQDMDGTRSCAGHIRPDTHECREAWVAGPLKDA